MRVILIDKENNKVTEPDIDLSELDDIYKYLKCTYFEALAFIMNKKKYLILCDEEGRLKMKKEAHPEKKVSVVSPIAEIVGNVIICKQKEEELVGLTDADFTLLRPFIRNVEELGYLLFIPDYSTQSRMFKS